MTRRPRHAGTPLHPLHAPTRRSWRSALGAVATGVTLGLLALGVYALIPESPTHDSGLPGDAKIVVDAPVDAVLDQPELGDLLSCIDGYVAEQVGGQRPGDALMTKAQQVCTDTLRAELAQD